MVGRYERELVGVRIIFTNMEQKIYPEATSWKEEFSFMSIRGEFMVMKKNFLGKEEETTVTKEIARIQKNQIRQIEYFRKGD